MKWNVTYQRSKQYGQDDASGNVLRKRLYKIKTGHK